MTEIPPPTTPAELERYRKLAGKVRTKLVSDGKMKDKEWERAIERHLLYEKWALFDTDIWRALQVKVKRGPMWLNLRADLWGCVDIAAMHPEKGFLFIQATTPAGVNERRRKIEVHGWPQLPRLVTDLYQGRILLVSSEFSFERVQNEDDELWMPKERFESALLEAFYRVEIWESRVQRDMADARRFTYAARVHRYHVAQHEWEVLGQVIPIRRKPEPDPQVM